MSIDQKRGQLIKQAFEKSGFKVRDMSLEGDSYRLILETLKGNEGESMEIYKKKSSDLIVFSSNVYLKNQHYEKYRHLDDDTREKFDNKLEELLATHNVIHEITEDEKGFGVSINVAIDHNTLNTDVLKDCYNRVNNSTVSIFNFLMDFSYDKIKL